MGQIVIRECKIFKFNSIPKCLSWMFNYFQESYVWYKYWNFVWIFTRLEIIKLIHIVCHFINNFPLSTFKSHEQSSRYQFITMCSVHILHSNWSTFLPSFWTLTLYDWLFYGTVYVAHDHSIKVLNWPLLWNTLNLIHDHTIKLPFLQTFL